MNEQLIEQRFNKIEEKIDKLTELLTQTQIQEHRLEQCEKAIDGKTPIVDISEFLNSDFMDIVMQIFKQKNK